MSEEITATFLIRCPDRKGLLAGVTNFFYQLDRNILICQQYTDLEQNEFYMRIKLDITDIPFTRHDLEKRLGDFANPFNMEWSVHYSDYIPRVAILVSKTSHCLYDLLVKQRDGTLRCEIPMIISNHNDLEYVGEQFRIPFICLPVTKENKPEQEQKILELLRIHKIDLTVLARYMQILSPEFTAGLKDRIINIHHAFLPAFQGGNAYRQAYERGVKMIGATAHYVTADLDEGPIIEQDVVRVTHESGPAELARIGRNVESTVLTRAVKAQLEHRIILAGKRTVVFSGASGI